MINTNIIARFAWDQVRRQAGFSLGVILFVLLMAATFKPFSDQGILLEFMEALPPEFEPLAGGDLARLVSPNGYLGTAYSHPFILILLVAYPISVGSGALAGEIERGTMRLLMARPLRRRVLVLGRALVMLVGILGLTGVLWLGTGLASALLQVEVDLAGFAWAALNAYALLAAIGGLSLFFSALSSSAGQAGGLAGGLILALYFLDYLSQIWEPLEGWGPLSPFHYFRPVDITFRGEVPWGEIGLLLAVGALGIALAAMVFERRDIAG